MEQNSEDPAMNLLVRLGTWWNVVALSGGISLLVLGIVFGSLFSIVIGVIAIAGSLIFFWKHTDGARRRFRGRATPP